MKDIAEREADAVMTEIAESEKDVEQTERTAVRNERCNVSKGT